MLVSIEINIDDIYICDGYEVQECSQIVLKVDVASGSSYAHITTLYISGSPHNSFYNSRYTMCTA